MTTISTQRLVPEQELIKRTITVEVGGVVHLGHYSIRNGMIRVTYGSSGKPTQLGGMSRTPQLLARLMLAEMVREHQGTVRGI